MTILHETSHKHTSHHEHTKLAPSELAENYLGNVGDNEALVAQVAKAQQEGCCFDVVISRSDRRKGRILTRLSSGQMVGIVKSRDWLLRDGDVLATENNNLVLIGLREQKLMALRFDPQVPNNAIALVHLGHVLGNHHWPITVQGDALYVELVAEAALMQSTVNEMAQTLQIDGLQVGFESRSPEDALEFSPDHVHH